MSYQISAEGDAIVVRLPRDEVDERTLGAFLDFLELEGLRRRSELSEVQAEALAREVQRGAWERVKYLFTDT